MPGVLFLLHASRSSSILRLQVLCKLSVLTLSCWLRKYISDSPSDGNNTRSADSSDARSAVSTPIPAAGTEGMHMNDLIGELEENPSPSTDQMAYRQPNSPTRSLGNHKET